MENLEIDDDVDEEMFDMLFSDAIEDGKRRRKVCQKLRLRRLR